MCVSNGRVVIKRVNIIEFRESSILGIMRQVEAK